MLIGLPSRKYQNGCVPLSTVNLALLKAVLSMLSKSKIASPTLVGELIAESLSLNFFQYQVDDVSGAPIIASIE